MLSQLDMTAELDASSEVASEFEALDASVSALEASDALTIPSYCRLKVDAIFWGGRQWFELAQAVEDDYSKCADYYISIPPNDGNRTQLRARPRFAEVRDLDAPIHPVAEIRWTSDTGWRRWVVGPTHVDPPGWRSGRTFYGAGVEARRRMAQRGLDVTAGETWAFNELTVEVLENTPVTDGPHAGEGARVEVLEFMRGLYDGAPGMPKARGIVFNVTTPSHLKDLAEYKGLLQSWLEDEPFWTELDLYANFFAHEVYASSRNWGVAQPLATRARYLNDYFHHPMILAENGPPAAEAARNFFRRTYVPLANALWPSPLFGETHLLSAQAMSQFISTQVYALRHYSNSHPQTGPRGRIGFGWAPIEENVQHGYTLAGRDLIRERLASAISEASEEGTNSQMGACGPPGEHVWCGVVEVEEAFLNDAWKTFSSWD